MSFTRERGSEMNENQKKTYAKIKSLWPDAQANEYDAGCYSVRVDAQAQDVSVRLPSSHYGVVVFRASDGRTEIDF